MMAHVYYRVDDRLIHGQVMTAWSKYYKLKQVIIVDDAVAKDPVQKQIISVVAPSDIKVHIKPVVEAPEVIKEAEQEKIPTLVLVKEPESLLGLIEQNVNMSEVILGGMQFKPERKKITKTLAVTADEANVFHRLSQKGVALVSQVIPTDRPQNFEEQLSKVFPREEV